MVEPAIVVARYAEGLEWLHVYDPTMVTVYNKGAPIETPCRCITVPNYGREAHTYLFHIVTSYETLLANPLKVTFPK